MPHKSQGHNKMGPQDAILVLDIAQWCFSLDDADASTGTKRCVCFEQVNTAPRSYVRPKMSQRGPLALVEGRHPLMEQLQGSGDLVPNDTYLAGVHPPDPILLVLTPMPSSDPTASIFTAPSQMPHGCGLRAAWKMLVKHMAKHCKGTSPLARLSADVMMTHSVCCQQSQLPVRLRFISRPAPAACRLLQLPHHQRP